MQEDLLATYKVAIEGRLREALTRHRKIDSMAATGPMVELQIREERERLIRLAEDNPKLEEIASLLSDWLGEQAKTWKSR